MISTKTLHLLKSALQQAIPAGGITVSDWADERRVLSAESSAEPGRWRTSRVPYAREWMDVCNDPHIREIYLMTSSQVAKSETLNNVCGYFIEYDPCPILFIQPTIDLMKSYSKKRLAPMFRDTPSLANLIADEKSRDSDNTVLSKAFPGGHLLMVGANTSSGLASNPIRVVLADEIDRYPRDVDGEGDPLGLAKVRTRTFPTTKKIIGTSTPTLKGDSRIEEAFESGDKRRYFVPCPHCFEFQTLQWDRVVFDRTEDGVAERASYACVNGCDIEEHHKLKMLELGEWRAEKPTQDIASFQINALYSVWYSWKDAANEFLTANKAAKEGSPEKLKVFINTTLGETWDASKETSDIVGLENRAEAYRAAVPTGVLCLTAGVDVQPNRLECHVVGWGEGFEAWSIDYFIFHGDPEQAQVWAELKEVLMQEWECEREDGDNNRLIRTIDAACIDSGGHNTQAVYKFAKANQSRRFIAVKGASVGQADIISKRPRQLDNGMLLYSVGTNIAKHTLFNRLKLTDHGAGYFHFPEGYDQEFYLQLTAEKKVKKTKKFDKTDPHGYNEYIYKKIRARNEVLDCTVYALAAVEYLNPNFVALQKEENLTCAKKSVILELDSDYLNGGRENFSSKYKSKGSKGFVSSWNR